MWDSSGGSMMQDFDVIEVESRASDALDVLRRHPEKPLIVLDRGGPACLLLPEDEAVLETGGTRPVRELLGRLPPVVVEPAGFTLGELVESSEFSAFSLGARGVIVTRDGVLAGVVPVDRIKQYLAEGPAGRWLGHTRGAQSYSLPVSDMELPGIPSTPLIVIHCRQFGHRNEVQYIDRRSPMECQVKEPHPHALR